MFFIVNLLVDFITYPFIQSWLNRQRGEDEHKRFAKLPKTTIYLFMTFYTLMYMLGNIAIFHDSLTLSLPLLGLCVALFGADVLRDAPSRGEIFPHFNTDTSKEKFALFIKPLTNLVAGYKFTGATPEIKAIRWKTIALSIYFTLFSIPRSLILAAIAFHLALENWWIFLAVHPALFVCGSIYGYCFKQYREKRGYTKDPVEDAEVKVGWYRGLLDIICFYLL